MKKVPLKKPKKKFGRNFFFKKIYRIGFKKHVFFHFTILLCDSAKITALLIPLFTIKIFLYKNKKNEILVHGYKKEFDLFPIPAEFSLLQILLHWSFFLQ